MGVKVRNWKGAWWIFANHQGRRKAKRVGEGKAGKEAAMAAAKKLQAKLALGEPLAIGSRSTCRRFVSI